MPLYDADGNEIEGALSPEEAQKLQEQAAELETKAKAAEELEAKLKSKEEELAKLASKDLNFKRLRDRSEAEIEEMKKKMTEKEKMLLSSVMELQQERDAEKTARFEEAKREILDSLTKGDAELEKRILEEEKNLAGEAKTPKELEDRYRKSYILARGEAPKRNPLFSAYTSSYKEPDAKPKKYTDTEEGKASLKAWFPDIAARIIK